MLPATQDHFSVALGFASLCFAFSTFLAGLLVGKISLLSLATKVLTPDLHSANSKKLFDFTLIRLTIECPSQRWRSSLRPCDCGIRCLVVYNRGRDEPRRESWHRMIGSQELSFVPLVDKRKRGRV